MHEHKVCEHELKYCQVCDEVYCELCHKTWRNYTMTYSTPFIAYNTDGTVNTSDHIMHS